MTLPLTSSPSWPTVQPYQTLATRRRCLTPWKTVGRRVATQVILSTDCRPMMYGLLAGSEKGVMPASSLRRRSGRRNFVGDQAVAWGIGAHALVLSALIPSVRRNLAHSTRPSWATRSPMLFATFWPDLSICALWLERPPTAPTEAGGVAVEGGDDRTPFFRRR